jgi:hypothetical protein
VSTELIVYVLTGLAAVVVVLTRLRLGRGEGGAGRADVGRTTLNVHTVAGALAVIAWLLFLFGEEQLGNDNQALIGIGALTLWWVAVIAGLLILVRWLPTHGKHAATGISDSWSDGPGLSILAHVGMLVGVCVFTYAYLKPGFPT